MVKRKKRKKPEVIKGLKCPFAGPHEIDYKDVYKLKKFITTRGRILSSTRTGVCSRCQRKLAQEIKKARYMALLPFSTYS
jgi:small subunit ribosomal protein S18